MAKINLDNISKQAQKINASRKDIMLVSMKDDRSLIRGLKGSFNVIDVSLMQSFLNQAVAQAKAKKIKIRVYNDKAMKSLSYQLTKKKGKNKIIIDNPQDFEDCFVNDTFVKEA